MKNKLLKNLVVLFVLLFSFGHLYAQGFIEGRLTVGAKGSLSYSTVSQSDVGWFKLLPGGSAGLYADFKVLDQVSVTAEFLYHNKGAKDVDLTLVYSPSSPYLSDRMTSADMLFQSIEIPVLGNYYLTQGDGLNIKVFAGPSFDFLLKGQSVRHLQYDLEGDVNEYADAADITERIKYWDFGAVAGAGAEMKISILTVSLDLRYRMGFTSINNVADFPKFTGRGLMLTAGVGYGF